MKRWYQLSIATMSIGPGLEQRRWRLRDGSGGDEEKLLDLVAAGDRDIAGGVVGGAESMESPWR